MFYLYRSNCERDALIVGCVNSFTSIYASIPVFAILGFKANENYNNCKDWYVLLRYLWCAIVQYIQLDNYTVLLLDVQLTIMQLQVVRPQSNVTTATILYMLLQY